MTTTEYTVTGLTCGHCVNAVKEEIGEIAGVTTVNVDLVSGGESTVTVTSEEDLSREDVAAAIKEAGDSYALV